MTFWQRSYGIPGAQHAAGALAIQCTAAWLLSAASVPGFWWAGAALGGGFFTAREFWQMRREAPPVWWQNRTPWDVLTAVLPVLAVALAMEFI